MEEEMDEKEKARVCDVVSGCIWQTYVCDVDVKEAFKKAVENGVMSEEEAEKIYDKYGRNIEEAAVMLSAKTDEYAEQIVNGEWW